MTVSLTQVRAGIFLSAFALTLVTGFGQDAVKYAGKYAQGQYAHKYFLTTSNVTPARGKGLAAKLNSYLTTINSDSENNFVSNLKDISMWIGLERIGPGTTDFRWMNGEPLSYTNWGTQFEPNNVGGQEYCVHTNVHRPAGWNDITCSLSLPAVIEVQVEDLRIAVTETNELSNLKSVGGTGQPGAGIAVRFLKANLDVIFEETTIVKPDGKWVARPFEEQNCRFVVVYYLDKPNIADVATVGDGAVTSVKIESNGSSFVEPYGDGLRIFPDKTSHDDGANRKTVKIRATTNVGQDVEVFFKAFDADDPSSDPVLDPNGPDGQDNLGSPRDGTLSSTIPVKTDKDGIAEVEFTVTLQPGDNFLIAAGFSKDYLEKLKVNGANLVDENGSELKAGEGGVSQLLTVWRKVHIEVDLMAKIQGNYVTGTIERFVYSPSGNFTVLTISPSLEDPLRFVGGGILINTRPVRGDESRPVRNEYFTVRSAGNNQVIVEGRAVGAIQGQSFTLYDDDDFNNNDGTVKRGDEGEAIPEPNTEYLAQALAQAYIVPDLFRDPYPDVAFAANVEGVKIDFDTATQWAPDYWVMYLLAAYQGLPEKDGDPDDELAQLGIEFPSVGSIVFFEAMKETACPPIARIVAPIHEIGHQFGITGHADGAVMAEKLSCNAELYFSRESIKTIRRYGLQ